MQWYHTWTSDRLGIVVWIEAKQAGDRYEEWMFDFVEYAWETANTLTRGSRLVNYPITTSRGSEGKYGERWVLPTSFLNGSESNMPLKARRGKVSVPAPAVIPALLAYIEVDAVKTLVVGAVRFGGWNVGQIERFGRNSTDSLDCACAWVRLWLLPFHFYFEEIRVFIAVDWLNILAWDNRRWQAAFSMVLDGIICNDQWEWMGLPVLRS